MSRSQVEWAAWARAHRACFQNAPLIEVVKGERVQVGFSLTLYVAAPLEDAPGPQRGAAIGSLWDELKALAEDVAPLEERTARVQLEQAARVVLRPENEFKPEVGLTFHLFPRGAARRPASRTPTATSWRPWKSGSSRSASSRGGRSVGQAPAGPAPAGMLSGSLPGLRLLRDYPSGALRGDVVAGVVLAAYLLPASLGDASLAGLPPQAGLYSCLFAGLVFWLVLQLAAHRDQRHVRDLAAPRHLARRAGRRRRDALRRARLGHGPAGRCTRASPPGCCGRAASSASSPRR